MRALAERIALVTGAASGLGAQTTRVLAGAGSTVIAADLDGKAAKALAGALNECPGRVEGVELDVRDERAVEELLADVESRHGTVDVVINNAGIDKTVPFDQLSIEDWDRVLDVNLRGPFVVSRLSFPGMKRLGRGHIVNIVSTAAKRAWANAAAYHASKWGLLGLSHALHVEAREVGVSVTALVAGGMRTPFILERFPDTDPEVLQDPANVAEAIRFVLTQPPGTVIPELMVLPIRETSWP